MESRSVSSRDKRRPFEAVTPHKKKRKETARAHLSADFTNELVRKQTRSTYLLLHLRQKCWTHMFGEWGDAWLLIVCGYRGEMFRRMFISGQKKKWRCGAAKLEAWSQRSWFQANRLVFVILALIHFIRVEGISLQASVGWQRQMLATISKVLIFLNKRCWLSCAVNCANRLNLVRFLANQWLNTSDSPTPHIQCCTHTVLSRF